LPIGAPPAFAPTAPKIARNKSDAIETATIIGRPAGDSHAATKGNDAPVVKVAAEVIAACTGRAVVEWVMFSSSLHAR
jgi:hypothetical protein